MRFMSVKSLVAFIEVMGDACNYRPLSSRQELIERIKKYPRYISDLRFHIEYSEEYNLLAIIVENPDIFAPDRLVDTIHLYNKDNENV